MDSNRLRLTYIPEETLGVTPATPSMRQSRVTGESLSWNLQFTQSEELRDDRNTTDTVATAANNSGGANFEWSFPEDNTFLSDMIEGALFNDWANMPVLANDGTADAVITGVTDSDDTYTVAAGGAAFKTGHLVRATGFGQTANNQIFRVASSTATTVVGSSLTLADEAAPAADARLKVVGFQGASGDITATLTGLASTTLDFTTLGLTVGQWVKIGGTAVGDKFATAAVNAWARITAIAATALTLDNLPTGWAVDAGTGKSVKVWVGDRITNGVTKKSYTFERGFMGQATPSYVAHAGCVIGTLTASASAQAIMTGTMEVMGTVATVGTTSLDDSPVAAPTHAVMNAVNNVGRIAEGGSVITGNYIMALELNINNNLRENYAVGQLGMIDVGAGSCDVTGTINSYYKTLAIYNKVLNATETSLNWRVDKDSKALVFDVPRAKFEGGNPNASGRNQDVMLEATYRGLLHSTFGCAIQLSRLEYFE